MTVYEVANSDGNYLVTSYLIPPGSQLPTDPGPLLEEELEAVITGIGGTPGAKDPSPFAGNTARQVDFTKGSSTGRCIAFLAGDRVVESCVIGRPMDEAEYQRLLASIQLR